MWGNIWLECIVYIYEIAKNKLIFKTKMKKKKHHVILIPSST